MSVAVNHEQLRRELARRGWTSTDLARRARLSHATISAACSGKPISAVSLRLIVEALAAQPALQDVDNLLL